MIKVGETKNPKKKKDDALAIVDDMAGQLLPGWKHFRKQFLIPVLKGRQERWIKSAYEFLENSEERSGKFKVEELFEDESFVTAFMRASQAAMRDHRKEKHKALQNALLNSALPNAPEEDRRDIFFGLLDDFTPLHLKWLSMYKDIEEENPKDVKERHELHQKQIRMGFPDFDDKTYMYSHILGQLASWELVSKDYAGTHAENIEHHYAARITPIGIEFMDFISSPFGDE